MEPTIEARKENFILNFRPEAYHEVLTSYMHAVKEHFDFILSNLYRVVKSGRFKGTKLLDVGSGPSVHTIASASAQFTTIVQGDLVEENRDMLKKWLRGEPSLDWSEFLDIVAGIEGYSSNLEEGRRMIESRIRRAVRAVVHCDVVSEGVLRLEELTPETAPPYDTILSIFCLEMTVTNVEEYVLVLKRLNRLLRKGGGLMLLCVVNGENRVLAGKVMYYTKFSEQDYVNALNAAGFGNHEIKKLPYSSLNKDFYKYESFLFVATEKL